jgi:predicted phosphoribosyltransferase
MFNDRKDAAECLAHALDKYRDKGVLVLGIPRGGTETAYYVAEHLNADLSLVVARKLGYPFNPEAAFGAVAEDESVYLFEEARRILTETEIYETLSREREEIQRRIQKLRRGKPLPDMKGRTVIIVDDGIATGATIFAVIELCKKKSAGKIVVAAPVSSKDVITALRRVAHDVVVLETPPFYSAVSQGYNNFWNLTDEEALDFMDKWEGKHAAYSGTSSKPGSS